MVLEGKGDLDWVSIRTQLRGPDFIKNILQFDSASVTEAIRTKVCCLLHFLSFALHLSHPSFFLFLRCKWCR